MSLEHEEITGPLIGAAIAVHKELGPGFLESVYEKALVLELRKRAIPFQRQVAVPILYQGVEVGVHRLDLFASDEIVVEIKAVKEITDLHFAIVRSYLRAVRRKHGLILNFSKQTLDVKRVLAPDPRSSCPSCFPQRQSDDVVERDHDGEKENRETPD